MANDPSAPGDDWQAVAGGWRRWEPQFQSFAWPLALRMAGVAQVGIGQRVLDVGCGIGDPTLQVAVLVGPHGRVLGVDLSDGMIAVARERAASLGLTHAEFRVADVGAMDLPETAYDVVLARWSLIFVRDLGAVLERLRRALVPGGRIAVSGWAPPEANPGLTLPVAALGRVRSLPAIDPAQPGVFHLSADGALARALVDAGFQRVDQERVVLSLHLHDARELLGMVTEMAVPLASVVASLAARERDVVQQALAEAVAPYRSGEGLRLPAQAQLAWGRA